MYLIHPQISSLYSISMIYYMIYRIIFLGVLGLEKQVSADPYILKLRMQPTESWTASLLPSYSLPFAAGGNSFSSFPPPNHPSYPARPDACPSLDTLPLITYPIE